MALMVRNMPANAGDTKYMGSMKMPWSRKWHPIPVFLPGKSHGQWSLVGYSPWGCKELDTNEWMSTHSVSRHNLNAGNPKMINTSFMPPIPVSHKESQEISLGNKCGPLQKPTFAMLGEVSQTRQQNTRVLLDRGWYGQICIWVGDWNDYRTWILIGKDRTPMKISGFTLCEWNASDHFILRRSVLV